MILPPVVHLGMMKSETYKTQLYDVEILNKAILSFHAPRLRAIRFDDPHNLHQLKKSFPSNLNQLLANKRFRFEDPYGKAVEPVEWKPHLGKWRHPQNCVGNDHLLVS